MDGQKHVIFMVTGWTVLLLLYIYIYCILYMYIIYNYISYLRPHICISDRACTIELLHGFSGIWIFRMLWAQAPFPETYPVQPIEDLRVSGRVDS